MADYRITGEFSLIVHGDGHTGNEGQRAVDKVFNEVSTALSGLRAHNTTVRVETKPPVSV